MEKIESYGRWSSPLTPARMARHAGDVPTRPWWIRGRPAWLEARAREEGRVVPVAWFGDWQDGEARDLLPPGYSVRSRVYEYGGGAWWPEPGGFVFVNDGDGALWRVGPDDRPRLIAGSTGVRWADGDPVPGLDARVCVRETATDDPTWPVHDIVRVADDGAVVPLVTSADYVAAPRVSPDARHLVWLEWTYPATPWLETRLMVGELIKAGDEAVRNVRCIGGGRGASVLDPRWLDARTVLAVSDRHGYWVPSRVDALNAVHDPCCEDPDADPLVPVLEPEGLDWGRAPWILGGTPHTGSGAKRLAVCFREGFSELMRFPATEGRAEGGFADAARVRAVPLPFTDLEDLAGDPDESGRVLAVATAPEHGRCIVCIEADPDRPGWVALTGAADDVRGGLGLADDDIARPEPVTFTGWQDQPVHAFLYRPRRSGVRGPEDERPPLIVRGHGGPTAMRSAGFDPTVQFWTTRGFAVLDVNYSGSAGFGRAYRERLFETWGVADRHDLCAGALAAAESGAADGTRMLITGNSAGGLTALAAVVGAGTPFAGAMSRYGVTDLERLRACTHKLESGYLEWLIGPWPDAQARYRERSPLHAAEQIHAPVLLLQGLEDRVVPPEQTRSIHDALRARGLDVRMKEFAGEGHGFRATETVEAVFREELHFAERVLFGGA